jgi:hypothetical protein
LPSNLLLAEGEVAGRGVEDQVDPPPRQRDPGPIGRPGVLADLEAEPNPAEIKPEVADRQLHPPLPEHVPPASRPGAKPAGLVVDSVAGQMLLAGQPDQAAVGDQGHGIVDAAAVPDREADRHGKAGCLRHDLLKQLPGGSLHAR